MRLLLSLLALVGVTLSASAAATTYYVSQSTANGYASGNDANNGTAKATPYLTVGKANSVVANGDTIILNDGTYLTTDGAQGATQLNITKGVTINPETTLGATIQGTSTTSPIQVAVTTSTTVTLGAIVIDAQGTASRGIVYTDGGTVTPALVFNGTKIINWTTYGIRVASTRAHTLTINNGILESSLISGAGGRGVDENTDSVKTVTINGLSCNLASVAGAAKTLAAVEIHPATNGAASTCTISGVTGTMTGNGTDDFLGVIVKNIPNAIVQNCNFTCSGNASANVGIQIGTSGGYQSDGAIIRSNTVTINAAACFGLQIGNALTGAEDNKCNNGAIYGNTVLGIYNGQIATPHGICIGPETNCVVYRNTVRNFYVGIIATKMTGGAVYDNILLEPYGRILYAKGSNGTKFYNNTVVFTNGFAGIPFYATNSELDQSVSTNIVYANNLAYSPLANQVFCDVLPLNVGWAESTATFSNNVYYTSGAAAATPWSYQTNTYATLPLWIASGHDTNSLAGDPRFRAITSGDFSLLWTSPAINAGVSTGGVVTTDFAGNPILGTPDIGAYEYQAKVVPVVIAGRTIPIP